MEIFIAGSSRSGTTLMARILDRHDQVYALPELHFFEQLWDPGDVGPGCAEVDPIDIASNLLAVARDGYLHKKRPAAYRESATALIEAPSRPRRRPTAPEVYLQFLHHEANTHGATVPCEHTPRNIFFLDEILKMSPGARIIVMIRDPRDVVLSQRSKWRRRQLSGGKFPRREAFRALLAYHPINVAMLWKAGIHALQTLHNDPRVFAVRYEELASNAEAVTSEVCEFLNLEWSADLLAVERRESSATPDSLGDIGVDQSRASAWKCGTGPERADISLCQMVCRKEMAEYGYQLEAVQSSRWRVAFRLATWPIRTFLTLLMNSSRVGSPWRAIRLRLNSIVHTPQPPSGLC
jgi:hypothetical protein